MFGIGFTELLLIAVIAILFLGPDKLPGALVEMAKFIKGIKKTIGDAKSSLEEEMKIADLKEEALKYKQQLNEATEELRGFKNLALEDLDDVTYDKTPSADFPLTQDFNKENQTFEKTDSTVTQVEPKQETVTFKKKPKKSKKTDNKSKKNDA